MKVEIDPTSLGLREEWTSIVTVHDDGRGRSYEPPTLSHHNHTNEADARHFKAWREDLSGKIGGQIWPRVTIQLRRRFVSEWEEVD